MRIQKVQFVYAEKQDSIYKEVGLGADIVEVLEDGYIDLDQVIGCSQFYEHTIVYMKGCHSFTIDMDYINFVAIWTK